MDRRTFLSTPLLTLVPEQAVVAEAHPTFYDVSWVASGGHPIPDVPYPLIDECFEAARAALSVALDDLPSFTVIIDDAE